MSGLDGGDLSSSLFNDWLVDGVDGTIVSRDTGVLKDAGELQES